MPLLNEKFVKVLLKGKNVFKNIFSISIIKKTTFIECINSFGVLKCHVFVFLCSFFLFKGTNGKTPSCW